MIRPREDAASREMIRKALVLRLFCFADERVRVIVDVPADPRRPLVFFGVVSSVRPDGLTLHFPGDDLPDHLRHPDQKAQIEINLVDLVDIRPDTRSRSRAGRGRQKIRVAGPCWNGYCNCNRRDGQVVENLEDVPPFHDDCFCYIATD